jgi:hypothetical protein
VPARTRLRPPGSDWLYLKVYGPRRFEDELIVDSLRPFAQFVTGAGLADGWFFLRDPSPLGTTPHDRALMSLLAARRHALPATRPSPEVCRSHVHLHCNRLLGAGHDLEHRVLELLRRTRESLMHTAGGQAAP